MVWAAMDTGMDLATRFIIPQLTLTHPLWLCLQPHLSISSKHNRHNPLNHKPTTGTIVRIPMVTTPISKIARADGCKSRHNPQDSK